MIDIHKISDPAFRRSKEFLPLLDHLLDLYNGIADNISTDKSQFPDLLNILRTNRPLFLPYLDTAKIEQKLETALSA